MPYRIVFLEARDEVPHDSGNAGMRGDPAEHLPLDADLVIVHDAAGATKSYAGTKRQLNAWIYRGMHPVKDGALQTTAPSAPVPAGVFTVDAKGVGSLRVAPIRVLAAPE